MPIVTNAASLREAVRAEVLGVDEYTVSDDALDIHIRKGLNRLNKDVPNIITASLDAPENDIYDLSSLDEWDAEFSYVRSVGLTEDDRLYKFFDGDFRVWVDPEDNHHKLTLLIPKFNLPASIEYTVSWKIINIDGSIVRSIPAIYDNAIIFITASFVCNALATEAAGNTSSSIPGDIVLYQQNTRNYRLMARSFREEYDIELDRQPSQMPAASGRVSVVHTGLSFGREYLSH